MLSKTKLADRVWAVYSDTQPEIGKAFCRFQEYYENSELRGRKDLTVRDIEKWWTKTREDGCADSYYDFWVGFNIPGRIFLELTMSPLFRTGASVKEFFCNLVGFPSFHSEEDQLLALISDLSLDEIQSSYFIGLSKTRDDIVEHELAHAFFSTNAIYKSSQLRNIALLPKDMYESIRNELITMGYHPGVVHDEIQAYMSTDIDNLNNTFDTPDVKQYTPAFVKTYNWVQTQHALVSPLASNE